MNRRAIPALVLLLVGFAALIAVGRDEPTTPDPFFATPAGTWMPSSPTIGAHRELVLSRCSGDRRGWCRRRGRRRQPLRRTARRPIHDSHPRRRRPASESLVVEPWSRTMIDVDAFVTTPFASVVVEIDGGRGFVEQIASTRRRLGCTVCQRHVDEWYFADGFTVDGSIETLVLTNPYDDAAVVDLVFATEAGESTPAAFQGFTILPQSVETIPIAELGARDEPVIAVRVTAEAADSSSGGLSTTSAAVASATTSRSRRRRCATSGGSPTARQARGSPRRSRSTTRPTTTCRSTWCSSDPRRAFAGDDPIDVPARQVVVYDPGASVTGEDGAAAAAIPHGRHAVGVLDARRAVDRRRAHPHPSVRRFGRHLGGVGCPTPVDGYVASRWHLGIGPSEPTDGRARRLQRRQRRRDDHGRSGRPRRSVRRAEPDRRPDRSGSGDHDRPRRPRCPRRRADRAVDQPGVRRTVLHRGNGLAGRSGSWALPASDN